MCTKNHNHMRYSYWDTEWQRIYHFGPFFTLFHPLLPNNPEKQILKKWKKASGDVIIFFATKNTIMWCLFTQIWSATDNFLSFQATFCSFALLLTQKPNFGKNVKNTWRYYPFTHMYHKSRSYDIWFLRYEVQQTKFFCHPRSFTSFYVLTVQKMKISTKWKKQLEISFYTSVQKMYHDHMLYCSWDMAHEGCNCYFHFGQCFSFLPP